jgi:hypothetical protein
MQPLRKGHLGEFYLRPTFFVLTNHTINFEARPNILLLYPRVGYSGNVLEHDKMVVVVVFLLAIGLKILQEDSKVVEAYQRSQFQWRVLSTFMTTSLSL